MNEFRARKGIDTVKNKSRQVKCVSCGKKFLKLIKEIKRSSKKKFNHCCSMRCVSIISNKSSRRKRSGFISKFCGNKRDELTSFRWFAARVRSRNGSGNQSVLNALTLKLLWESQNGVCPITGFNLVLPESSKGWAKTTKPYLRASVDRIDSSIGYELKNIRFVSLMYNLAKSQWKDSDAIEMCKAVVKNLMESRNACKQ